MQLLFALLLALSGCATSQRDVSVNELPPEPPPDEARAERPEPRERPIATRPETIDGLEGVWHLADADAEARIDRAVSEVTDQMSFFVRGIANGRIDEAVNPDRRVTIEPAGEGHLRVAIGRGAPVRLPLDGRYVRTTGANGQPVRTRALLRNGSFAIQEVTEQGSRTLYFRRHGDSLVMATRIRSSQLPADIVYRLRYREATG